METLNSNELIDKVINDNDIVLVYFGSSNCGVCVDMKPKIKNILTKYDKIKGIYVDTEKSSKIAISYSFFTIPAILVFVEGKETIREARHISILDVDTRISRYYNLIGFGH